MRSPSRSASARRLSATIPSPSPRIVPSASALNGRQSPLADSAGVLLKHTNMNGVFSVSTPPVNIRSACPRDSSLIAADSAASEPAQAASTVQLVPCRSKRLAIRPVITLASRPGKVASCHGTNCALICSQICWASSSGTPDSRSPFSQAGRARRASIVPMSARPPLPRMMPARSLSRGPARLRCTSVRSRSATTSPSSWAVSVASMLLGGMLLAIGSKSTSGKNAPRRQ